MLYYLAIAFQDQFSFLNVLTYNTVRAGGAALTGFILCLVVGPPLIRWLRAVKVGQYIRQDHVADLHALHKGKAGTPTMGGSLVILSTVVSLLLWARLSNPLLLIALFILVLLGGVGFLDDYAKLRRKHNQGLSAKAKFAGQIIAGMVLGFYLVQNPITFSATYLNERDIADWGAVRTAALSTGANGAAGARFFERLAPFARTRLETAPAGELDPLTKSELIHEANAAFDRVDLYEAALWPDGQLTPEALELLQRDANGLDGRDRARLGRLLFEAAFPEMGASQPNLHTKVNIPGFKNVFLSLGVFYVFFVIIVIVGSSNAVNLTDGLDGLAIGASIMSLMAYTAISYVVSRADWSQYLFLAHVPAASELTVFGAALLGTGLGFLWFNSHPAEVFMGDTGSLALGGAIGSMAILTKQELLLVVVGGLFVIEAGSVIIQVLSFKLRGKRVFKMAPLHHHFELMGWSETKVTMRFYILALLFALLSLTTLKLR